MHGAQTFFLECSPWSSGRQRRASPRRLCWLLPPTRARGIRPCCAIGPTHGPQDAHARMAPSRAMRLSARQTASPKPPPATPSSFRLRCANETQLAWRFGARAIRGAYGAGFSEHPGSVFCTATGAIYDRPLHFSIRPSAYMYVKTDIAHACAQHGSLWRLGW